MSGGTWIFPTYTRLPMGSSHSVHILMTINLEVTGRTLWRSGLLLAAASATADAPEDEEWGQRASAHRGAGRTAPDEAPGLLLEAFLQKVRRLRHSSQRVCVVLHLFSGPPRDQDVECSLHDAAAAVGLALFVASVDLSRHVDWDITKPRIYHALFETICQGLIDVVIGGPPCATWSKLRYKPNGPPPLRFRTSLWCFRSLPPMAARRVREENLCAHNCISLMEAVAVRGGAFILEHPVGPETPPLPSIWATSEVRAFEHRTSAKRCVLDQCSLGGVGEEGHLPGALLAHATTAWPAVPRR